MAALPLFYGNRISVGQTLKAYFRNVSHPNSLLRKESYCYGLVTDILDEIGIVKTYTVFDLITALCT